VRGRRKGTSGGERGKAERERWRGKVAPTRFDGAGVLGRVKAEPRFARSLADERALTRPARASGGMRAPLAGARRFHTMLRIYPVILEVVRLLRVPLGRIERRDRDLGRQLRRAAASVALNVGEGMFSRGKNRALRYHTALGSAREVVSCLEVANAFGYLGEPAPELSEKLREVVGTLVRLVEHG
jgi:four helix bundle protein